MKPNSGADLEPFIRACAEQNVPRHYSRAALQELHDHLRCREAELIARGMRPEEARTRALEALGNPVDYAAAAANHCQRFVHRHPIASLVLAPLVLYALGTVAIVPLAVEMFVGLSRLAAPAWLSPLLEVHAVTWGILTTLGILRIAGAHAGVDRFAALGLAGIGAACALFHPGVKGDLATWSLQVAFEPNAGAWRALVLAAVVLPLFRFRANHQT